ncbi:DUF2304 domain-containing protein [Eggerthella sinensis]|uniref:DUF2304 domain-containing protein n=1 Tax=Eggerthella sinensis TaxID=242230 RepID=A0A3N0IZQ6_9ACTN|nr:DUF2304 domain-containing protein [Eggerthella sinensis]MCB7038002.1 DUF2304 domain-containing protein [Eggerthella sinensis]RDB70474.1 DUF2304 domain-containing protein [Eggerthella sinensis]RNM42461.1 DUF2304 domain-containing protein [Eggerthella sinensis]
MTLLFQSILIVASLILAVLMLRRVAQTRAKIEDSIFWLALCFLLILLGVFPGIASSLASLIGIYSSTNFIFLFFIFVLIVKLFFTSMRVSKLEMQIQELSQSIALSKAADAKDEQSK